MLLTPILIIIMEIKRKKNKYIRLVVSTINTRVEDKMEEEGTNFSN